MMWGTWVVVGVLAVVASGAAVATDLDEIIAGIGGSLLWGLWAIGATNIEKTTDGGCCTYVQSEPALAFFGGAVAVVMFLVALRGTIVLVAPGKAVSDLELNR